jgi:hypothetical protein
VKVLEILRNWRRCSSVNDEATFQEVALSSALLDHFEKKLGAGNTRQALDLAIEHEAVRQGREKRAKAGGGKSAMRGGE